MRLLYLDSNVVIAFAQGDHKAHAVAAALLSDDTLLWASSDMVWLETRASATARGAARVRGAYEWYFEEARAFCQVDREVVLAARTLAEEFALGGADAIHAAAALRCGATEFVTLERRTKPYYALDRAGRLAVRHLDDV